MRVCFVQRRSGPSRAWLMTSAARPPARTPPTPRRAEEWFSDTSETKPYGRIRPDRQFDKPPIGDTMILADARPGGTYGRQHTAPEPRVATILPARCRSRC